MLARTLGMTLADLRRRMSVREFRLWSALYDSDPWGPERIDLMLARVAAVVANCHSKKGFTEADFMPEFGGPVFIEADDDLDERLRTQAIKANALMGGTVQQRT